MNGITTNLFALTFVCIAVGCSWQHEASKTDRKPVAVTEKPAAEVSRPEQATRSSGTPTTQILERSTDCSGYQETIWHTDLATAMSEAKRLDRPLLVVSILGDLAKRC